jgi:LacI family transcriptional regulator
MVFDMSAASHTSAGYPKVLLVFPTAVEVCRRMLRGILRYVRDAGPWELHIEESPTAKTLKALDARSFSGIIAYVDHAAALNLVLASRAPCLIVDPRKEYLLERKDLERFTRVSCDSGAIGRAAADYFLERHYKHFAFVGERNNIHWSSDRRDAFAGRVKQAGYGCHVYQPKHARQRPSPAKERSLLCDWLLSLPKPVALMAAFDVRGRQVIEACGRTGLVVPHEVSVLSVDNDEIYCGTTNPPHV